MPNNNNSNRNIDKRVTYPVLPLRNTVMAPNIITPLLIGRKGSVEAVEKAFLGDKKIICVTQLFDYEDNKEPKAKNLYRIGTLANTLQIFRLPDDSIRLLVEGVSLVKIHRFSKSGASVNASSTIWEKKAEESSPQNEALYRTFKKVFLDYLRLNKSIPEEAILSLNEISRPDEFFYFVLANVNADIIFKQKMLEIPILEESIKEMLHFLSDEIEILKLENRIDDKVKKKLTKTQKEYYLTEQLKIIQRELGIGNDENNDILDLKKRIEQTSLSEEALKKANEEFKKLNRISHHSPEYSVTHNYLNWILDLPWEEPTFSDETCLKISMNILERDHYGLKKVKERIIEYLAVIQLAHKIKGQIMCFVGPPGVGKTSLGKSIAEATGRKFVRLSLGGVRDEAEIRGHRRTYIGAMPGVIIQSIKKAETKNPLIMMDEVDKLSRDFRGDPASALLEVLDPEQNNSFRDHYLDFGYDLSQVMFITTANSLNSIPQPLIDRMEIIRIPGYTLYDKYHIAKKHLIPKLHKEYSLEGKFEIRFSKQTIEKIISSYTREAGVRDLERNLTKIFRKIIKNYIENLENTKNSKLATQVFKITPTQLTDYLGIPPLLYSEVNRKDSPGIVTGLAWTQFGGETLQIESVKMKGSGKVKLTGKLGATMQESAQAALSYSREHYKEYNLPEDFYNKVDIHLHIPEGAIPKDGPSAGVAIVTSFISILTGKPVRADIAMTGEITLSGKVLPIGGLEEKLIAAKRANLKTLIIPQKNEPELTEISQEVTKGLDIILVNRISEVLNIAI